MGERKTNYNWFWNGMKSDIPLCCVMFFEAAWTPIKREIKEYGENMSEITNNQGIILCPDCLVNTLEQMHE